MKTKHLWKNIFKINFILQDIVFILDLNLKNKKMSCYKISNILDMFLKYVLFFSLKIKYIFRNGWKIGIKDENFNTYVLLKIFSCT